MRLRHIASRGAGGILAAGAGLAVASIWLGRRAERAVPADGGFVEVEGFRLHYTDRGHGTPIVLIHGLGGQLRNFDYGVATTLARHHRVVAFDRPRSGYSSATGTPGLRDQAMALAEAIRAIGLVRPLIVGHSLGGAVALMLALDHSGLASGLALVAPLTQPETEAPRMFRGIAVRNPVWRWMMARIFGVPLGRLAAAKTVAAIFAPEDVPPDFAIRGGGVLMLRPAALTAAADDLAAAEREMPGLIERYRELDIPVSILFAREDQVLSAHRHGRIGAGMMPGARLELVHGGHMLPITQPDRTARFILDAAAESRTSRP